MRQPPDNFGCSRSSVRQCRDPLAKTPPRFWETPRGRIAVVRRGVPTPFYATSSTNPTAQERPGGPARLPSGEPCSDAKTNKIAQKPDPYLVERIHSYRRKSSCSEVTESDKIGYQRRIDYYSKNQWCPPRSFRPRRNAREDNYGPAIPMGQIYKYPIDKIVQFFIHGRTLSRTRPLYSRMTRCKGCGNEAISPRAIGRPTRSWSQSRSAQQRRPTGCCRTPGRPDPG